MTFFSGIAAADKSGTATEEEPSGGQGGGAVVRGGTAAGKAAMKWCVAVCQRCCRWGCWRGGGAVVRGDPAGCCEHHGRSGDGNESIGGHVDCAVKKWLICGVLTFETRWNRRRCW